MSLDLTNISNVTSQNMTEYAASLTNAQKAQQLKDTARNATGESTDEELMDACKEFESYFLEQIFKEMYKTVDAFKSDDTSETSMGNLVDYFKNEAISDIAETSTETNGLGLAQMLYENMKHNYDL